jgi:ketosteroid isomerase-like protein
VGPLDPIIHRAAIRSSIARRIAAVHESATPARDTAWTMSEENVALARKAIDAFNRGDFDTWLAFLSPDVVWEALEGVTAIGELYRGRAGVREWTELMLENAEQGVHIEIEQMADLGDDRVFIAVVLTARRRGSGVPFEYRTWQIVWFGDGLITRRQAFWTRAEALRTAGLRE